NNGSLSGDTIQNLPAGTYLITVEDSNGCDTSFSATLVDMVGIAEGDGPETISISPNPVSSQLAVGNLHPDSYREANVAIEIYNMIGETSLSTNANAVNEDQITIDVSALPA